MFICNKNRPKAIGKKYLLFGIALNEKNQKHSPVILCDISMDFMLSDQSVEQIQNLFLTCPLLYVARIPNGRASPETQYLIDILQEPCMLFLETAKASQKPLQQLDTTANRTVLPRKTAAGTCDSVPVSLNPIRETEKSSRASMSIASPPKKFEKEFKRD